MTLNIKKINPVLLFTFILFLQAYLMIAKGYEKEFFHIDEAFTFMLSNSEYGLEVPDEYKNRWRPGTDYYSLLTSSPENTFNYKQVYTNQVKDVHPPLYYFIIHTISSLFPQQFSKWFGIIPNIFFFLITQVFIFLLSSRILDSKYKALLPCLLYGFSLGAVSTVEFIRMYTMLTTILMIALYVNYKIICDAKTNMYIYISIINTCGYLTHYHYIIYSFFISIFTIFYLHTNSSNSNTIKYIISNIASIILFILIYPAVYHDIFSGYRGIEAFHNFATTTFLDRLCLFYDIINRHMFCSLLTIAIFSFSLFYILKKTVHYQKVEHGITLNISIPSFCFPINIFLPKKAYGLLFLVFIFTASLTIIIKTAAYTTFRYISPLYPLLSIITSFIFFRMAQKNIFFKISICLLTALIIYSGINFNYDDRYKKYQKFFSEHMNTENIIIVNPEYNIFSVMLPITNNYKNIYIMTKENINNAQYILKDAISKLNTNEITVCIPNETPSKHIEDNFINSISNKYQIRSKRIGLITSIKISI